MKYIVVTDLDGTLLDHQTYEFTPALVAIAELRQREIPIVLNSSKTRAEISAIRQELNNQQPFVCENGGVLCEVENDSIKLGTPRQQFLKDLQQIKQRLGLNYQGFASAMVDDVVQWTGLSAADAEKAMQREATEPILWQDTERALNNFRQELKQLKLQCVKGGRFYHVMGTFDKASCFTKLKEHYFKRWQDEIKIIALGDSPNDLPMLERADLAIIIPPTKGNNLQLKRDGTFTATQPGPYGWQEGIDFWLKNIF